MLGTTAIRHPTPTRSFALTHSPWGGRGAGNQSCAQDSPSTCTTFFLPRCAPTGKGTSSRSPQATAQSAWGPRAVGAHACGHRSCSSVRTLRSSSCPPKRVSTLELSERQVTPLALPQVPTPATGAHGKGSSSPTGARKVISAPGDCSKLGSVSGGWGQRDRCGRRGEHWTTEPGRERQRERDMQRRRLSDRHRDRDGETETQRKTQRQRCRRRQRLRGRGRRDW